MQIFLDIKDIESDKKENLLPFPIIFGFEKTLFYLYLFNFVSALLIITLLFFNIFPKSILMLLFTIIFNFYFYAQLRKQEYLVNILQGGKFIFWPFLIIWGEAILCFNL